jgi:hypothetical protein
MEELYTVRSHIWAGKKKKKRKEKKNDKDTKIKIKLDFEKRKYDTKCNRHLQVCSDLLTHTRQ